MLRVLESVGLQHHPDLNKWVASVGRLLAGVPGDPTSLPKSSQQPKAGVKPMATFSSQEAAEDALNTLQTEIEKAQARHDSRRANKLYARQLEIQRSLPGGSDPAVGHGGVTA